MTDIKMLWIRGTLDWLSVLSIRSFQSQGCRVYIYTYDPLFNAPDGVRVLDARAIISEAKIFEYKSGWSKGYLSGFANWFRYELLYKEGGWWCDCDVIAIKNFAALKNRFVFASGWEPSVPRYVNNNVIFCQAQGEQLFQAAASYCREKGSDIQFAETGPDLLHRLANSHGLTNFVTPSLCFNPIHYADIKLIGEPLFRVWLKRFGRKLRRLRPIEDWTKSSAIHLYANLFRRAFPDATPSSFNRKSLMYKIVSRYTPDLL